MIDRRLGIAARWLVLDDPNPALGRQDLDPVDLTAIALHRLCLQNLAAGFALNASYRSRQVAIMGSVLRTLVRPCSARAHRDQREDDDNDLLGVAYGHEV